MASRQNTEPHTENEELMPQARRDRAALLLALAFFLSFLAGLVLVFGGGGAGAGGEFAASGPERPGIAVLDIDGPIMFADEHNLLGSGQRGAASLAESIRLFAENRLVRGLVVRVNSPGGSVAATQEIYNALKRFREEGKPVVVSMGDVAASGGYYIAAAASSIFANAGSITGSIGVIMTAPNLSGLYDWAHIEWNVIKSGRYKDIMSPFRRMTDDERALLADLVKDAYEQFFDAVHVSREITREKLESLAEGQVFSGRQAQALGLVDEIGDFEAALLAAAELAGIPGRPYVIRERAGGGILEFLGMGAVFSKLTGGISLPGLPQVPLQSGMGSVGGHALPPIAYLMPGAMR